MSRTAGTKKPKEEKKMEPTRSIKEPKSSPPAIATPEIYFFLTG